MKLGVNIEDRLSGALGHGDDVPNIMLAEELSREGDVLGVAELARLLCEGSRDQQKGAIKVLYEVGERTPALISVHSEVFFTHMVGLDFRLVWGSLMALASISLVEPRLVLSRIEDICSAADVSSVLAKDQVFNILWNLLDTEPEFTPDLAPVLFRRLENSSAYQFHRYAEKALQILPFEYENRLREILLRRLTEVTEQRRVTKIDILLKKYQ